VGVKFCFTFFRVKTKREYKIIIDNVEYIIDYVYHGKKKGVIQHNIRDRYTEFSRDELDEIINVAASAFLLFMNQFWKPPSKVIVPYSFQRVLKNYDTRTKIVIRNYEDTTPYHVATEIIYSLKSLITEVGQSNVEVVRYLPKVCELFKRVLCNFHPKKQSFGESVKSNVTFITCKASKYRRSFSVRSNEKKLFFNQSDKVTKKSQAGFVLYKKLEYGLKNTFNVNFFNPDPELLQYIVYSMTFFYGNRTQETLKYGNSAHFYKVYCNKVFFVKNGRLFLFREWKKNKFIKKVSKGFVEFNKMLKRLKGNPVNVIQKDDFVTGKKRKRDKFVDDPDPKKPKLQ
jgi:hypothetical protein